MATCPNSFLTWGIISKGFCHTIFIKKYSKRKQQFLGDSTFFQTLVFLTPRKLGLTYHVDSFSLDIMNIWWKHSHVTNTVLYKSQKLSKSRDSPRHVSVRTYLSTIFFLRYCMLSPFWKICKTPTSISRTKIFINLAGKSFFHPEILSTALAGVLTLFPSFNVKIALHYDTYELDNIILVSRFWN